MFDRTLTKNTPVLTRLFLIMGWNPQIVFQRGSIKNPMCQSEFSQHWKRTFGVRLNLIIEGRNLVTITWKGGPIKMDDLGVPLFNETS